MSAQAQAAPSLQDVLKRQVARFVDRVGDWDAFADGRMEPCKGAQHRFIGAGASGKPGDLNMIPAERSSLSIQFVPVGQRNTAHSHQVEEVTLILKGKVMVFFEDGQGDRVETAPGPWDCVSAPAGVIHGYRNVGCEPAYLQVMPWRAWPDIMGYADRDLLNPRDEHLKAPR